MLELSIMNHNAHFIEAVRSNFCRRPGTAPITWAAPWLAGMRNHDEYQPDAAFLSGETAMTIRADLFLTQASS